MQVLILVSWGNNEEWHSIQKNPIPKSHPWTFTIEVWRILECAKSLKRKNTAWDRSTIHFFRVKARENEQMERPKVDTNISVFNSNICAKCFQNIKKANGVKKLEFAWWFFVFFALVVYLTIIMVITWCTCPHLIILGQTTIFLALIQRARQMILEVVVMGTEYWLDPTILFHP